MNRVAANVVSTFAGEGALAVEAEREFDHTMLRVLISIIASPTATRIDGDVERNCSAREFSARAFVKI